MPVPKLPKLTPDREIKEAFDIMMQMIDHLNNRIIALEQAYMELQLLGTTNGPNQAPKQVQEE